MCSLQSYLSNQHPNSTTNLFLNFSTTSAQCVGTWSAIVIDDVDVAASQEIQIKVSASKGTLTLGGVTTNLIFVEGNGVNDAEIEFKGKLNDINLAFEALTYHALPNENGK